MIAAQVIDPGPPSRGAARVPITLSKRGFCLRRQYHWRRSDAHLLQPPGHKSGSEFL